MQEKDGRQLTWRARNEVAFLQGYLDSGGDLDAKTLGHPRLVAFPPMSLVEVASQYGSIACIKLLLDRGADMTVGHPLNWAARGWHVSVIKALIDAGAVVKAADFVDIENGAGFATLLDCFDGDLDAVAAAYVRGAGVDDTCLALLIRRGADIALPDDAYEWQVEMIEQARALAAPGAHPLDNAVQPLTAGGNPAINRHTTRLTDDRRSVIVSSHGSDIGDAGGGETTIKLPSWVHVFASDDFVGIEYLGSGAFGEVTKRKLFGSTAVAVKMVKLPTTPVGVQSFLWEVASHVMLR